MLFDLSRAPALLPGGVLKPVQGPSGNPLAFRKWSGDVVPVVMEFPCPFISGDSYAETVADPQGELLSADANGITVATQNLYTDPPDVWPFISAVGNGRALRLRSSNGHRKLRASLVVSDFVLNSESYVAITVQVRTFVRTKSLTSPTGFSWQVIPSQMAAGSWLQYEWTGEPAAPGVNILVVTLPAWIRYLCEISISGMSYCPDGDPDHGVYGPNPGTVHVHLEEFG